MLIMKYRELALGDEFIIHARKTKHGFSVMQTGNVYIEIDPDVDVVVNTLLAEDIKFKLLSKSNADSDKKG